MTVNPVLFIGGWLLIIGGISLMISGAMGSAESTKQKVVEEARLQFETEAVQAGVGVWSVDKEGKRVFTFIEPSQIEYK